MLINFKFKNFMSFGDECYFEMTANSDKQHRDNLIDDKYSRVKLIYGANASGKTSFIKAIAFIRAFVFNSNTMLEKTVIPVMPFKFRADANKVPSEFAVTFIIDGVRYYYEFACTRQKVVREKLDVYYTAKATNIFERKDTDTYIFKRDIKVLREISAKNTSNKLFLVTAATWNYQPAKPVVDYILNKLLPYGFNEPWQVYLERIKQAGEYEEYMKFCLDFFNSADISISDFEIKEKKLKDNKDPIIDSILSAITKNNAEVMEQIANSNVYNVNVSHKVSNGVEEENFVLDLQEESLGTIHMFELSPVLYYVLKNGITFFIDEIDRSLHPMLVRYIVSLFLDSEANSNNAQLIANTHDTNLLDLDLLRRDEIWFAERDFKTGKTVIYPLTDFSPRKNENIEKAYLLGRFGAVPFIKEN